MVMMIRVTTEALRAGRIASRSKRPPATTQINTARIRASQTGSPALWKVMANMAPSMANSPWEKLRTPVTLKVVTNPTATRAKMLPAVRPPKRNCSSWECRGMGSPACLV